MPPLARNTQINCYSNQPSFETYRVVRLNEPVYSNCCRDSITLNSKQPNLPKYAFICSATVYTRTQKPYLSTSNDLFSYPSWYVAIDIDNPGNSGCMISVKNLSAPQRHVLDRMYSSVSVWNGCSLLRFTVTGTALCIQ